MTSTRLAGHGLRYEGRVVAKSGAWLVNGSGPAKCECGEYSPVLQSTAARKRWHREHKAEQQKGGPQVNTDRHEQTLECHGLHCTYHGVDEPDGEEGCLECGHAWATSDDLLADHNRVCAEYDVPPAARINDVHSCPYCTHDL